MSTSKITHFSQFVDRLNVRIGCLGGRYFFDGKTSYSMNEIVQQFKLIYDEQQCSTDEIKAVIKKITELEKRGNEILSQKSCLVRTLTAIRRFVGNFFYDRINVLRDIQIGKSPVTMLARPRVTDIDGSLENSLVAFLETDMSRIDGLAFLAGSPSERTSHERDFVGLGNLKRQHAKYLARMFTDAKAGRWRELRAHCSYGFDWWMFLIDDTSRGQGGKYTVTNADICALQQDQSFLRCYRLGVILVARSWGWDLLTGRPLEGKSREQYWAQYPIRLGKMIHSLYLFGEIELLRNLKPFVESQGIRGLSDWYRTILFTA